MQLKMQPIHYRVLGIIASFHGPNDDVSKIPYISAQSIAETLREQPKYIKSTLDELDENGLIDREEYTIGYLNGLDYQRRAKHFLNTEGRQAIQEAVENPELVFGQKGHDWKDEALTGITKSGKRSDINHAALPSNTTYYKNDPEKHLIKYEITLKWIRELSRKFDLPEDKIHEMIKSGEINYCKGAHHDNDRAQIFGRDGNRWQRLCKKCRAKKAREKRRKK